MERWSMGVLEWWSNRVMLLNPTFQYSHTPTLHFALRAGYFLLSKISGHIFIALRTAVAAVWPRPQREASVIVEPTSVKRSRSPGAGSPDTTRSRISYCRRVPSWQG